MENEGVAEWSLERADLDYAYSKQRRIKDGNIGFLRQIRSKVQFEHKTEQEMMKYLKSKLKDLAHNHE